MDKLWKSTERELARLLGGERIPVHSTSGVKCDVATPIADVEVKERKSIPSWLSEAVSQAKANCRKGQIPLVILHTKSQRHENDLVIMNLSDYRDWFVGTYANKQESL